MKKCPACNSTRVVKSTKGTRCERCGYVNNN